MEYEPTSEDEIIKIENKVLLPAASVNRVAKMNVVIEYKHASENEIKVENEVLLPAKDEYIDFSELAHITTGSQRKVVKVSNFLLVEKTIPHSIQM